MKQNTILFCQGKDPRQRLRWHRNSLFAISQTMKTPTPSISIFPPSMHKFTIGIPNFSIYPKIRPAPPALTRTHFSYLSSTHSAVSTFPTDQKSVHAHALSLPFLMRTIRAVQDGASKVDNVALNTLPILLEAPICDTQAPSLHTSAFADHFGRTF